MSAERVPIEKQFVLETQVPMYQVPQSMQDRFDIRFSFLNTERDRLGIPLPGGRVRVLKADESGTPRFLGEDRMRHTPEGDTVRLTIGKAFDLTAERTQKSFRSGDKSMEVGYELVLNNRKKEKARLVVREKFGGDWTVVSQTESGKRVDSTTQEYVVDLAAGATRTFNYTVRVSY